MKRLKLLVLLLFVVQLVVGQDTTFIYRIGSNADEYGVKILPYGNSEFILLANTGDQVFEENSNGLLIWLNDKAEIRKTYLVGANGSDVFNDFLVDESHIYMVGSSNSMNGSFGNAIYKIDTLGNKTFEKFNIPNAPEILDCVFKWDNRLFVYGKGQENTDIEIIELSESTGDLISIQTLSQTTGCILNQAKTTLDGSLLLAGKCPDINGLSDALLVKVDTSFQAVWQSKYETLGDESFEGFTELSDGTIVAVGYTTFYGDSGDRDILVVKFDSEGDTIKSSIRAITTLGSNQFDEARCVVSNSSDSVFISGYTKTFSQGQEDLFLSVNNSNIGDLNGSGTAGTVESEIAESISLYRNGIAGVGTFSGTQLGGKDVLFFIRKYFDPAMNSPAIYNNVTVTYGEIILTNNQFMPGLQKCAELKRKSVDSYFIDGVSLPISWVAYDLSGKVMANGENELIQLPHSNGLIFIQYRNSDSSGSFKILHSEF